jgi:glycosyltransferase involved in cell wall biosynthesis
MNFREAARQATAVPQTALLLLLLLKLSLSNGGVVATLIRIARGIRQPGRLRDSIRRLQATRAVALDDPRFAIATTRAAAEFRPRVLIVAILDLAQCAKYRVWQKKAYFERLGIDCTVIDWTDRFAVRNALQVHSLVIFYRLAGYPFVLKMIAEAKRLNLPSYWEVDDLIFDREAYLANANLDYVDAGTRTAVLSGIPLFQAALRACGRGIASTAEVAAAMREHGASEAVVIENALDAETIAAAAALRARRVPAGDGVTIVYGSGTNTHSADFLGAADALAELLRIRPQVRLRIVGALELPPALAAFSERVERLPLLDFNAYLDVLAQADISIAPLQVTRFNNAKSNIKYIEASILGVPSVATPCDPFRQVIRHGVNGFLADSPEAWLSSLTALVDDAGLRRRVGEAALQTVERVYAPARIAAEQVAPFLDKLFPPRAAADRPFRILSANVYFAPESFGGATVVAEQMAQRLSRRSDTQVSVLASWNNAGARPHDLIRYEAAGAAVVAVRPPTRVEAPSDAQFRVQGYDNAALAATYREVLRLLQPDVVHLHAMQGLSVELARACRAAGIPYVVTLHDAWWLCERQFMVREDLTACLQTRIDWNVCKACVPDLQFSMKRAAVLRDTLDHAAALLAPSPSFRDLYRANGFGNVRVHANAVDPPAKPMPRRPRGPLRFGLSATHPVKGSLIVRRAFQALARADYELVLVDDTRNLGFSTLIAKEWRLPGKVTVVPAYRHEDCDDFFAKIDVLLYVTQLKESFGLTVREALMRDKWVIATDCGAPAEDIVDGVNGTIVPFGSNHRALMAAIVDLLDRPAWIDGYVNPRKPRLPAVDAQAEELRRILLEAARGDIAGAARLPATVQS